ncbi:MAG: hypothetical protein M0R32_10765 [Candidatus Cloacimonetes bacterium]|jgi:hypothetical protein|nr:hypothetical protein [Candidatus Cloacimonadota bacterium]
MSPPKSTKITGKVVEARYYPQQQSLALVIEDYESKKRLKPMQISSSSFHFRPDQDIDEEMEKTAHLFRNFKHKVTLIFDPEGNVSI